MISPYNESNQAWMRFDVDDVDDASVIGTCLLGRDIIQPRVSRYDCTSSSGGRCRFNIWWSISLCLAYVPSTYKHDQKHLLKPQFSQVSEVVRSGFGCETGLCLQLISFASGFVLR